MSIENMDEMVVGGDQVERPKIVFSSEDVERISAELRDYKEKEERKEENTAHFLDSGEGPINIENLDPHDLYMFKKIFRLSGEEIKDFVDNEFGNYRQWVESNGNDSQKQFLAFLGNKVMTRYFEFDLGEKDKAKE